MLTRTATPSRSSYNIGRIPGSHRKADTSPSERFERLDGSPEEMARASFETPTKSGSSDAATPTTVHSVDPSTRLFPPLGGADGNPRQDQERAGLQPHSNNTVALHNPVVTQTNNGQYTLDPSILNLPLGTLLSTPAGAQFLATLGQSAASFLGQPGSAPASPRQRHAVSEGSRFSDATVGSIINGTVPLGQDTSRDETVPVGTDTSMMGMDGDTSWMSTAVPQAEGLPDHLAPPFLDNNVMPNVIGHDAQNPSTLADGELLGQDVDFDWSDPAVKALLQAFENQNQPSSQPGEPTAVEPNVFTNDDQYEELFQDAVIDFDGMFNNTSNEPTPPGVETATPTNPSATNSIAGDVIDAISNDRLGSAPKPSISDELFAGPTRKKRKTDQREP